jgi:hypothetical protein
MPWSRVTVDLAPSGEPLAAWVERFDEGGENTRPASRYGMTAANLVEFTSRDLWAILTDIAMYGAQGWSPQADWQPALFDEIGPFDQEAF